VRKAVGGFLRYVQFRDQHAEPEAGGLDAFVRYVAHRDRTSPGGRVFGPDQDGVEVDRRRLVNYVSRSTKGLAPRWVQGPDGKLVDQQRAVYQLILSPEDWRGLDLRRLAGAAMKQLEEDAGTGGIGPWFAAEHRNTAHHHVHIVLAARRELEPGNFQTLVITRNRLQRMKEAVGREIEGQRGLEPKRSEKTPDLRLAPMLATPQVQSHAVLRWRRQRVRPLFGNSRSRPIGHVRGSRLFGTALLRLRGAALSYHHQMERELEEDLARREREGWMR
jgi:type IV secretory pathway VirD2 relaxase